MTSKRKPLPTQLRRSISEQLRDSTARAWDLLWRNVRERRLAEIEAKEACDWLRAAGFPQYAQLYEDSQFPINILAVKNDHDFLERDLVEPLYRRLNTLNKCASMKLDVNFQRKKGDDSDEENLCISNKWTFQRTSRRWSRVDDLHTPFPSGDVRMRNTTSSESVLTDLSEPEVGGAPGAPGPKERKCQEASKRGGMYLEDLDVLAGTALREAGDENHTQEYHSQENLVVHVPKDHKPGTFPKALSIESLSPTDNSNGVNWRTGSISLGRQQGPGPREPGLVASCHRASRVSIYDNVPGSHLYASTGDLLDLEKDDLFPHLDDILHHVSGLQEVVDDWSKNVLPELQTRDALVGKPGPCPFSSPNQITLDFEGNSVSEGRTTPSDVDRDATSLNESEAAGVKERRDSGVGASLTRPNRRLRWNSFQLSHQPQPSTASPPISSQTAGQLNLLQRFSLLRLTAIMEKHSMSNKHGWTWSVPKFMKRMKVPDYKDKTVFGVPLIVHVQRTGQPLPQSIQEALRYLRSNCLDQVGLFRKSGVKSRIHALRQMNENFPENVSYEDQSAYDVADMVKQFFRDLPEPLFTNKLSDTFLHIYQLVSAFLQLMHCSLVHALVQVPLEMLAQSRNSYAEAEVHAPTLEDLGTQLEESGATFHTYLEHLIHGLQKEAKEKFKGWVTCSSTDNTDLAFKKVGDGNPLKLWKASVEVEAPPSVVLNRVLRERHLWDEDFVQWKVVETLDKQTEIYQYVLNTMAPHPSRDFVVLRTWKTDLPKGMCALLSLSVDHEEAPLMGGVRAIVMDSQYLIEPCGSGKSRLTHICRIDLKGHSPEWYNKGFGHLCAAEVAKIRNSFQPLIAEGPETKI
ncbi:stAR-related lipid transfer protein 13 [Pteropus vampyrus]|uniref:StAR-related lipid transfer protein 13 n=1 Tax=Pteropus vampyrus TaxID=132908 RepID=A0A6P6CJ33_PTEVA|nr:stAR-related lipid transfer protein 13 [Pteropus vampyrus]